jgi:phosphoribosyl 1,2-cyclic phosphate phosphodiesterase
VCLSDNPFNKRLRSSLFIKSENKNILIDSSLDFRQQAIKAGIDKIDLVLFTHPHPDHIGGITDLKMFTSHKALECKGSKATRSEIKKRLPFLFSKSRPSHLLNLKYISIPDHACKFTAQGLEFIPITLEHGKTTSLGYRYQNLAYLTDCSGISEEMLSRLKNLSVLILDCSQITPHSSHLHLKKALDLIEKINPDRAILTHMGHEIDYTKVKDQLPNGVELAFDMMTIHF